MAQNVDFTQDENTILWSSFLKDSRYSSEGIGIYEGGCTYMSGVYRPTEDSMMNTNTCGFNTPSRKAIYDMVMRRGENRETTYEEFADFDSRNAHRHKPLPGIRIPLAARLHVRTSSTNPLINKASKAKRIINELTEYIYVSTG